MKMRFHYCAFVSLLAALCVSLPLHAQPDPDSPWPMFHGDARNTGQSGQLSSQAGRLLWSYYTGGDVRGSACAGSDGTVYFGAGSSDNTVYALSFEGALRWSYATGGGIQGTCALSANGNLYCGSSDRRFYALTGAGGLGWSYETGDANDSSPVEGDDGTAYFGSSDNCLYAISSTGGLNWSYATEGDIHGRAGLGDGGNIYFGALDHHVYGIESTGSLSWSYRFDEVMVEGLEGGAAIGSDGAIYFGTRSIVTALYAMESDGTVRWMFYCDDIYGTPALSNDGTIYFGSIDNEMYALNSDGSVQWSYTTGEDVRNGTAAIGIDGTIYASSRDGSCYAMDSSGNLKWSYRIGDSDCAPSIGYSGTLYAGSSDNVLYAFEGLPTPTPTATPIPNYVELRVTNGTEFHPGMKINLEWESNQDRYGFTGRPCAVYLAAAMDPPAEDTPLTVKQIISSKALFLFDSKLRPVRYDPKSVNPTFSGVRFPLRGMISSGEFGFTAPGGAGERWVFAAAFVMLDSGQFPAQPPVEVSNGFTLR